MPIRASPKNTPNGAAREPCAKHGRVNGRATMREHYKIEERASAGYDLLCALIFAAVIGAPFIIYFWNMQP